MNPEIEAEKNLISLNYVNQCFNAVVAELAAARVEIRQLKAQLNEQVEAAKPAP
jgi:hypothetical protein